MDPDLKKLITRIAAKKDLGVDESFFEEVDDYVVRYFKAEPQKEKLVISSYLADVGMRIAKTAAKTFAGRSADASDAKAALWLLHVPNGINDECRSAGDRILMIEKVAGNFDHFDVTGTEPGPHDRLSDEFRVFLDKTKAQDRGASGEYMSLS